MEKEHNSRKFESVFSQKVRAGKRRTYFFDVRKTKGDDYYITLTESTKKFNGNGYERHKIFLYKEDFFHIIGEKESKIIIEELNILFKPLREYRNCKERAIILNNMKSKSETKTLDIVPLLCEHEEVLKDKIEYALKLLRGSKFYV